MNAFTIKDIETLSGVKAHTIRIWEQRYNFLKPKRTGTNIRYYNNEELKIILNIALLNKFGFKISHIDKMNLAEINQQLYNLSQQQAQHERVVNDLISYMVDMDVEKFETLLDNQFQDKGIEKTIDEVVFPFLERIGILWMTSNINPAQEHIISNIIRQKLLVGIEVAVSPIQSTKTALLFLPEGEYHELGLLYVYYLLKMKGVRVLYLGANVPLNDLNYVVKIKSPDYLFTHLTAIANNFNIEKFFNNLHSKVKEIDVVVSGPITLQYKKYVPPNFLFKKSLREVKEFFS